MKDSVGESLDEKGHTVHAITPGATIVEAVEEMCRRHVGALVVCEDVASAASLIGIVALSFAAIGIHGLKAPFWALAPMTMGGAAAAGGIAWINSVGNLGGYFGPQVMGWLTDHFGGYRAGVFALAGFQVVAMLLTLVLRPQAAKSGT